MSLSDATHKMNELYEKLKVNYPCTDNDLILLMCGLNTKSIFTGLDIYSRPYIYILVLFNGKIVKQRLTYLDERKIWIGDSQNYIIDIIDGVNMEQYYLIENIINEKIVEIELKHNPILSNFIGKVLCLYNEKEVIASKIIQNAWLKCRYNPGYKMCETVLMNNLYEIAIKYNKY